jgi:hypothetical protein
MSIFGANLFSFNRVKERNADNKINKLNIKQMFAGQTHGPFQYILLSVQYLSQCSQLIARPLSPWLKARLMAQPC